MVIFVYFNISCPMLLPHWWRIQFCYGYSSYFVSKWPVFTINIVALQKDAQNVIFAASIPNDYKVIIFDYGPLFVLLYS